jgi:hypothetical protein
MFAALEKMADINRGVAEGRRVSGAATLIGRLQRDSKMNMT